MGLDVSHDAFSGAYSAFNRFRQMVAKARGGSYPPHDDPHKYPRNDMWYAPEDGGVGKDHGLYLFLTSNDCGGVSFTPAQAKRIADELEKLLPRIREIETPDGGHIGRDGGFAAVTEKYIKGCRLAHSKRQKLVFG